MLCSTMVGPASFAWFSIRNVTYQQLRRCLMNFLFELGSLLEFRVNNLHSNFGIETLCCVRAHGWTILERFALVFNPQRHISTDSKVFDELFVRTLSSRTLSRLNLFICNPKF